jgi:hypothetical protein
LHVIFGLTVEKLWDFKDFSLALGRLSATVNAANSAQNCQNLPKFVKKRSFEIPPKIKILVFSKMKISMYIGGTRACFHRSDFQSNFFSYAIFIAKKRPLYVNFSIPPCRK